jgi:hypothetical protein
MWISSAFLDASLSQMNPPGGAFIYLSFHKLLLNACYKPGTILDTRNIAVKKRGKAFVLTRLAFHCREAHDSQGKQLYNKRISDSNKASSCFLFCGTED